MKYVPILVAAILAISINISVFARQQGDSVTVAGNSSYNFSDSTLIYNYIGLSKQYINSNPDSSLLLADLAIQIATKINNPQIMDDAFEQKKLVQSANMERITKQNELFSAQNAGMSGYDGSVSLIVITILLFIACIYLSVLYRKKNNVIKVIEASRLKLEHRNRELLQFQKEILEKNAQQELEHEIASHNFHHLKQNDELAKVNSIKDRLIPMIAHDIRSPLASLQHMLSLTRESILSPEEFQKLSLSLEADIYNLRGMLDNMLLWTREQMIEIKIQKITFDISEAMQSVILMHRNSLIAKNIAIHNYLQQNLQVFSDKDIIMAVIRNIFSNAVKFTDANKNIYINQIYLNNKIYISIKDEGKGINKETLEKLNNSEHVTTRGTANEKGTGIGIMFTKDLLKKLDEAFDITSMPGSGTSVTFSVAINNADEAENTSSH